LKQQLCAAPARPFPGCVGAFVLLVLFVSCERTPFARARQLDIGGDTVQLAPGASIRDVQIRAAGATEFTPASTQARSGDVVRLITADSRTHLIVFDEATLPGNARQLFNAKTQLRSPPLLVQGATWIVSLEDAPPGTYRFTCETHGRSGDIVVR
jgi:plastocyanin